MFTSLQIATFSCNSLEDLKRINKKIFKTKLPAIIDCHVSADQEIIPSLKSKLPSSGKFVA